MVESSQDLKIKFCGSKWGYSKVFFFNIILTFFSFGFYYPLAVIKSRKYIAENIYIGGSSLQYHYTKEYKLLDVFIIFIIFYFLMYLFDMNIYVFLCLILMSPILIVHFLRFKYNCIYYKDMKLKLDISIQDIYILFIFKSFITAMSLGLYFPFQYRAIKLYFINNMYLGDNKFSLQVGIKKFLILYFLFVIPVLLYLCYNTIPFSYSYTYQESVNFSYNNKLFDDIEKIISLFKNLLIIILFAPIIAFAIFVLQLMLLDINDYCWSNTSISNILIERKIPKFNYAIFNIIHMLLIVISFGMLYSFIKISKLQFMIKHINLKKLNNNEQ